MMRWARFLLTILAMCILALAEGPNRSAGAGEDSPPAVRAVLFYAPDCADCRDLFVYFLPALFERYGTRIEMAGIDTSQAPGSALYDVATTRYGLPMPWGGEPTVVTGDKAILGLPAIVATLGDDFEGIASDPGASHWPALPGLDDVLARGIETVRSRVTQERAPSVGEMLQSQRPEQPKERDRIANALSIVVLVGMVVALSHALARLRRPVPNRCRTTGWMVITLCVGLGISGYTAYTALADVAPMCGPIGSCDVVQKSEYAKLFGVPMGVLGLFGYVSIFLTWLIGRRLSPEGGGWCWLPWAIALFGTLFSLRLTALEPFVIGATCLWCLGSAVTMTTVLWLLSGETRLRSSHLDRVHAGKR